MDAFGACTSLLVEWTRRAIASAKTHPRLWKGVVPKTMTDPSSALSTTTSGTGRRRRVDALYAMRWAWSHRSRASRLWVTMLCNYLALRPRVLGSCGDPPRGHLVRS